MRQNSGCETVIHCRQPAGKLHSSGSTVADCYLLAFHDNWNFTLTIGMFKHLIQFCSICLHIKIYCSAVVRPGLVSIGSATLAIDDNLVRHNHTS